MCCLPRTVPSVLLLPTSTSRVRHFDNCWNRTADLRSRVNAPAGTDIYVVRHAHVHNPHDILYGRLPRFRLSELGLEQARKVADFLSGRNIEAIYSSPLLRARQTAEMIAQSLPGVPM